MQTHTICHCGKCKVTCNKHGKRAKCDDCRKRRLLGTAITRGQIRHICDDCCVKASLLPAEPEQKNNWDKWEDNPCHTPSYPVGDDKPFEMV